MIRAAVEAHDLEGAGHAIALTDGGVAGGAALDCLVDGLAVAAYLGRSQLVPTEQISETIESDRTRRIRKSFAGMLKQDLFF